MPYFVKREKSKNQQFCIVVRTNVRVLVGETE